MKKEIRVGILKYMDHTSLNRIEAGTKAGLDRLSEKYGLDISYDGLVYDGEADMEKMKAIGKELAEKAPDLVITIATPPAVAVQETLNEKGILLVFRAVSNPVGAGLVTSFEETKPLICGSSDSIDGGELAQVMAKVMPGLKKAGLLYNRDDFSSKQPVVEAKAWLDEAGIEWIEANPEDGAHVREAAEELLSKGVDAVLTPTDNIVAGAEREIAPIFAAAGVPHFTGSHSFCINGAFTGLGSRYRDGDEKFDALMEDLLVKGVKPEDTAVLRNPTTFVGVNRETMTALGFVAEEVQEAIESLGLSVIFMDPGEEVELEGDL